jgi:hypothetical protein
MKYIGIMNDLFMAIVHENTEDIINCAEQIISLAKDNYQIKDYEREIALEMSEELDGILDNEEDY